MNPYPLASLNHFTVPVAIEKTPPSTYSRTVDGRRQPTRYSLCGALSVAELGAEPVCNCPLNGPAALQRVRAGDRDDLAMRRRGRHSERVALALDDERGDGDRVELVEPALLRSARRVDREGEAEHRRRAGLDRRPAGDARTRGAAAG